MEPNVSNLLINFDGLDISIQEKENNRAAYGSFKLDTAIMDKCPQVPGITFCQQPTCRMALTDQDKQDIYDYQSVKLNKQKFTAEQMKKMQSDQRNNVCWICRFCEKKNILDKKKLYFTPNKSRYILEKGVVQDINPIILILFDTSSSMEEVIEQKQGDLDSKEIKKTKLYDKLRKIQENSLTEFFKKQKMDEIRSQVFTDYMKKNKFLMGLTEMAIDKIRSKETSGQGIHKQRKKKIGFIFFNSVIYLDLPNQEAVAIYHKHQCKPEEKYKSVPVNYEEISDLFKVGAEYGSHYKKELKEFNFLDLDLKNNSPQGQTALGPAIAVGMGVLSKHGPGSFMMVVTDGKANRGIFQQGEQWKDQYYFLKTQLRLTKSYLIMMLWAPADKQLQNQKSKQKKQKYTLESFLKNYEGKLTAKFIIDSKNLRQNQIQTKLTACLAVQLVAWNAECRIKCENPKITYESKLVSPTNIQKNYQKGTLDNSKQYYFTPNFKTKSLTSLDYRFPFMTQIIINYENAKGNKTTFVSFMSQRFINYQQLKAKEKDKLLDNEKTLKNMLLYLEAEDLKYNLSNMVMDTVRKTFHNTIMSKTLKFKTIIDNNLYDRENLKINKPVNETSIEKKEQKYSYLDNDSDDSENQIMKNIGEKDLSELSSSNKNGYNQTPLDFGYDKPQIDENGNIGF